MSNSDLYTLWGVSLGITLVIVIIAATLLIAILITARNILANARAALAAAEAIAGDTEVIWELDTTNQVAGEILDAATSIEERGERIVGALHNETQPAVSMEAER